MDCLWLFGYSLNGVNLINWIYFVVEVHKQKYVVRMGIEK